MESIGQYDVEVEILDEKDNVVDSSTVLMTNDYQEALEASRKVELHSDREQVSIWEWDEDRENVIDSTVIKEYSKS